MGNKSRIITLYILGFLILLGSLSFTIVKSSDTQNVNEEIDQYKSRFFSKKSTLDGPYIFYDNDTIKVKWTKKGKLVEKIIEENNYKIIKRKFGFEFKPEWINKTYDSLDYKQSYKGVEKLIAISDIHGQYDLLAALLKKYKVVDQDYNWAFGKGHLVIVGDMVDRGPYVNEILWLVFRLEQQAELSGGKVHVVLGNHELMVLNNDVRYINPKYIKTAKAMGTTYNQLYNKNTFIGRWLRSKPIIITINDMLFVHAGISTEFVANSLSPEETNKLFNKGIVGQSWKNILESPTLSFLMDDYGPIWYRGYFEDTDLNEQKIDNILNYFNTKHIIVGHTSFPNIVSLFNGKIYGIDSSIKYGEYGEVFMYTKGKFTRGTSNGFIIDL